MEPLPDQPIWPHAPLHQLDSAGAYFVTAGTYEKLQHFRDANRLSVLHRGLLKVLFEANWSLEAWAVFSNHYHFIARPPNDAANAGSLSRTLGQLHARTAAWINRLDASPGRRVWHNYWETRLTYERSYLARLRYVHENPVHHGLVDDARKYPYCSASWFEQTATPARYRAISSFKIDRLNVRDEYVVDGEWSRAS